ncbi:MAG TPA: serine/threonine-protein kinase, partial [Kofleriaceae bacterium]|nr:serine/threonine-protein kinase [Kofleriaceae bacterium]
MVADVVDAADAEPFGPYLVYERLGVGGMATVHRALEQGFEGFERIVALKRLLPHLAEDASFIKSFVREAKLASLLSHVHIVQIFELGRVGTEYFISMEYIDGRDVRRILRHARNVTGPPPIHVTTGLLLQLCEALDYAHTKVDDHGHPLGLIHRDVSPSNVLVTRSGHLKVIDFGIAKAQSSQLRTQSGRVKGKLAYMAPEAVAGKELDARSDLFAVGVIAHELLTARPLFANRNEYQTLIKVQRGDIMPPSTFNQTCPPELDEIVLKALARDPDDRFASAAELRGALHELRRHYHLQTGHRDIARWIERAFSVEPDLDTGRGDVRVPTPPPDRRRGDEEAAVDLAWGGGETEHDPRPVVLDDVPDVSDKHLAGAAGARPHDDLPPARAPHGPAP